MQSASQMVLSRYIRACRSRISMHFTQKKITKKINIPGLGFTPFHSSIKRYVGPWSSPCRTTAPHLSTAPGSSEAWAVRHLPLIHSTEFGPILWMLPFNEIEQRAQPGPDHFSQAESRLLHPKEIGPGTSRKRIHRKLPREPGIVLGALDKDSLIFGQVVASQEDRGDVGKVHCTTRKHNTLRAKTEAVGASVSNSPAFWSL